jgi:molybdate transport repressor ModE-like protein
VTLSPHVPDLDALHLLLTVAHTGSFGTAGRELGLSQQAVSARVRGMERVVGLTLVTRSPQGSRLTPAGALVADWAARLLELAGELDAGISALRGQQDSHLRICASLTIAEYLLPSWLVALRTEQAQAGAAPTAVTLTMENSEQVATHVREGKTDLGFVEGPEAPSGVHAQLVASDELVVVVPAGHRWSRRQRPLTPTELAGTALVARESGSGTRQALERALSLASAGKLAPPALELSATTAIRGAVLAGAGPAVLSSLAVSSDLAAGTLVRVRVDGVDLHRTLRAIWMGGAHPAGPARDLLRIACRIPSTRLG